MAKNKRFKRQYTIEITGVTTNHFMERFIDTFIGRSMLALANKFAQVEIVTMTAQEIDVHEKLEATFNCAKCGALTYHEDGTCLFCAAEGDKDADSNL